MISRLRLKYDGTPAETRYRLSAKRTSPFKSAGASVQSTTSSRGVRISGSNAGYTIFRGGVKGTGYPLHSPVSPSLPLLCITVCHHISTGLTESFCWHVYRNTESKTPSLWDVVRLGQIYAYGRSQVRIQGGDEGCVFLSRVVTMYQIIECHVLGKRRLYVSWRKMCMFRSAISVSIFCLRKIETFLCM